MSPNPSYTKPPIVEALLDIQVDLPGDFAYEALQKCQQRVKKEYPERTDTQQFTGQFTFGREVSTAASSRPHGYTFSSPDKQQLFQAKLDGFTFNRLGRYPGWASFVEEAKRLWEEYRRVTHPRGYKRVALRFINRFDFPHPGIHMQKYFRTAPEIAPDLPQEMNRFFFQVQLPLKEIESTVTITQTAVEPVAPEQVSIILDIDLFRTESLPSGNELWPLFETLRSWKNRVFEACITEQTRELIR